MTIKQITMLFTGTVLTGCLALGQVSTGSLGGTVLDSNGASIPGVKLTAISAATNLKIETVSNDTGSYAFPSLRADIYSVQAEKTGFKKLNRSNIQIPIGQRVDLTVSLEVGDVQQSVEVTAEAPALQSSTSEIGQTFSPKFMNDIPLFTGGIRNPRAFVTYMPGVNSGAEVSISGSGGRAQEVQIDGASAIIPESGGVVFNMPAAEMFQEFKLTTGSYAAELGRFGGGVETYATKSGSNWYHGTAFLNMRRDIWNSNAWVRTSNPNPAQNFRPKERQNEIGGAAGGPIFIPKIYDGRDKTFFYFTYTQRLLPAVISFPLSTVPTAAMKSGNFSELGTQLIYDPATTANGVRAPFPNNTIPQARFSNVAKNLLPLIPNPTRGVLLGNYDFVNTSVIEQKIWSLKFDHAFTPNNRLAFFVSKENGGSQDTGNFAGPIGNSLGFSGQLPFNLRFNHDWSITPNFLLHSTVGYTATRQLWNNPAQAGWASKLGIPGQTAEADAMPRINFRGAAGLSPYGVQDGKVANGGQDNDTLHISQGATWIKGKHEFKFGWDHRRLQTFGFDLASSNGQYFFSRNQTAVPGSASGSGHEFASLLLGAVEEANRGILPVILDYINYRYTAGYFSDNWRVSKRLTVNLGMRYEVPIGWFIPTGNYGSLNLNRPNPGAGNLPGALEFYGKGPGRTGQIRPYPTDYSNIGPRAGFAYQLSSKTVLRGGWGIFYQTLGNGGCGCRPGFAAGNAIQGNFVDPVLNWDGGIPVSANYAPPPNFDPSQLNFQGADFLGPTYGKAPRVTNWSFNIQHEVARFLIDVGYIGNRANGLNSSININQLQTSQLAKGSLLQSTLASPAGQAALTAGTVRLPYASYPLTRTVAQALRPFPQYLDVISRNSGQGQTWYDSLQAKVQRRFGNLQLLGNYTWSKSLANAHYRQIFSQHFNVGAQDAYNLSDMKSFLPFDQPHVFNLLFSYDLPFGGGKRFLGKTHYVVNALVSGWTVSGIARYNAGSLIQLVTPGNPLAGTIFSTTTKANVNNSVPIRTGATKDDLDPNNPNVRWFNAGAFSPAPAFTLGNAALYYNDFRQPMVASENIGIAKRTILFKNDRNPVELLYRADAFNLFNRTRFGGVNGVVGNANFGRATGPQVGARAITMGLRLSF